MSEYANVEKPFLDKLRALGWEIVDHGGDVGIDAFGRFLQIGVGILNGATVEPADHGEIVERVACRPYVRFRDVHEGGIAGEPDALVHAGRGNVDVNTVAERIDRVAVAAFDLRDARAGLLLRFAEGVENGKFVVSVELAERMKMPGSVAVGAVPVEGVARLSAAYVNGRSVVLAHVADDPAYRIPRRTAVVVDHVAVRGETERAAENEEKINVHAAVPDRAIEIMVAAGHHAEEVSRGTEPGDGIPIPV